MTNFITRDILSKIQPSLIYILPFDIDTHDNKTIMFMVYDLLDISTNLVFIDQYANRICNMGPITVNLEKNIIKANYIYEGRTKHYPFYLEFIIKHEVEQDKVSQLLLIGNSGHKHGPLFDEIIMHQVLPELKKRGLKSYRPFHIYDSDSEDDE